MTLPKSLVSLLLIYCFVFAATPHIRAEIPEFNSGSSSSNLSAERSSIGEVFDFLS
jgi:hypothetical protein